MKKFLYYVFGFFSGAIFSISLYKGIEGEAIEYIQNRFFKFNIEDNNGYE